MSETKPISRRNFLKKASAGAALGLTAANYRSLAASSPNDTIVMGFIGLGGMGTGRLREFLRHDDVKAAAICDVDESHLNRAIGEVSKRRDHKPKGYHDFRELLEISEIDAVTVTTPDHWHALPTITACQAGKDVFVEKPLCHNIAEGRKMADAVKKYKRITQLGTHIHNTGGNYRRVVEMVRSGNLGKITRVHCWKTSNIKGLKVQADGDPPEELDYDFWQGPAPKRPYNPNRSHFSFRHFWDYSGGTFIDFWCHITDVVFWSLELGGPKTVAATGGRFFIDDQTETPDSLDVLYEYPELVLAWTLHPKGLPGYQHMGSIGCVFQGTKANLVTNYNKNEIWVDGKKTDDFPRPEKSIPGSPGHLREFLNCIKSREECTCNIEYAHRLTKPGHLGNIAYRTGEKLEWDDEKEKITNSAKANRLVKRRYRKPWKLG